MKILVQDLRFAVRTLLLKNRVPTIVCVATLALGIGANTAIFSVVKSVLLEPLPYGDPERLFRLHSTSERRPGESFETVNPLNFLDYREGMESLEWLACANDYNPEGFNLSEEGRAQRVAQLKVSSGFFEALGVRPALGRTFRREEEIPDRPEALNRDPNRWVANNTPARPLAVISHRLWQSRLGGAADAVGSELRLDGALFTIIGVMPQGFRDLIGKEIDVWVPLDLHPGGYNTPGNSYLSVLGKLKPGVSFEAAQRELDALSANLGQLRPQAKGVGAVLLPLHEQVVGEARAALYALLAAVGLLLLAACVNVASLFLARAASREREMALRTALGSTRLRLVRQLLTESLLVSALGGAAGLLLSFLGVKALLALGPQGLPRADQISFDGWIFLFTAAVALLTGILFGLAPALRSSRPDLEQSLRGGGRGQSGGGVRQRRMGGLLVAAQVALAVVLLLGGGLLLKSLSALLEVELGFDPKNAVSFRIDLPESVYAEPQKRIAFYNRFQERMEGLAGIRAAGAVTQLPVSGRYHSWGFRFLDRPRPEAGQPGPQAEMRCVDGNFFQALGIALKRGRLFQKSDAPAAPKAALVNEALARKYFPDGDPLGERISTGGGMKIVGVVADVRHEYQLEAIPKVYFLHDQMAGDRNWSMTQVVSSGTPRHDLAELARRELAAIDPGLAIYQFRTLDQVADAGVSRQRFAALLMGAFAAVALALAAVGLYGVLSHSLSCRRHEIGIRMALGGGGRHLRGLVVRQAMAMSLGGIAVGLAGALALTRWLLGMVYQVSATDPAVFAAVPAFMALVALAVAYIPARRATRVDPLAALREE